MRTDELLVTEEKYKGYNIKIYQDIEPEDPREWDNLGYMICFHKKYILGDKHNMSVGELKETVLRDDIIALPLYLFDHSGVWMSTSGFGHIDPHGWDWGQVGYIYVDYEIIRDEFPWKRITRKRAKFIENILETEVELYNKFLTGDFYGEEVIAPVNGEVIDSCWGFTKAEEALSEARSVLRSHVSIHKGV